MRPEDESQEVERISSEGKLVAIIVRSSLAPSTTTFLSPDSSNFQLGFVVYPKGGVIRAHVHKPLERRIIGTAEFLFVRKGRCEIDLFAGDKTLLTTRPLNTGDVVLLVSGGHGLRMLEDTILLEIKQGPYTGLQEKEPV